MKTHTGIIRLKPERIAEYIILHKNVFPGVLHRIAASRIRNYSIFLAGETLFSFYEYHGSDHHSDMAAMAQDEATREWWQLTEPMQLPLPGRKEGEWWATTQKRYHYNNEARETETVCRYCFMGTAGKLDGRKNEEPGFAVDPGICRYHISFRDGHVFLYLERHEKPGAMEAGKLAGRIAEKHMEREDFQWVPMQMVFHTDLPATKKVFVTGCFDMLHSGHVAFLSEAATYGEVYAGIGSDENVQQLKGRYPVNTQEERMYMLNSLKFVKECMVNRGFGIMDFLEEIKSIRPDIFIVNEDGNTPGKAALCRELGIEYQVLKRIPHGKLPGRSTTGLREECSIPYRIDLAGGWLDQPFVSKHHPGPVITISIEPLIEFNYRSGMATSTRKKAIEMWKTHIPSGPREQLAKMLFTYENPPGTVEVAGSQDALGILMPGVNKFSYDGAYWPASIESRQEEDILQWIEESLFLIPLGPRGKEYRVLENTSINAPKAGALAEAAESCWQAILSKDRQAFGASVRASFEAQAAMFPNMVNEGILSTIESYKEAVLGWKLSGAGGGGYLIFVADKAVEGAVRIRIRRKDGM